ncbi:MAG TPA: hypothetical protein VG605_17730 [Puia sp.]|nr:hypothetical protein [Puia sp.]
MKKFVYLIAFAAFSAANAQDTSGTSQRSQGYAGSGMNKAFTWSIGVEPSLPVGNFNQYSAFGLGGSLQGEYKPGDRVGITLNGGFIDYFGKTVDNVKYPDFKYIPVMAGVKLYFGDIFYIHGQAGPGFGTNGLGTSFWYGGGPGVSLGRAVDLEIKYTGWKQNEVSMPAGGGYMGGTPPPSTPSPAPGPYYGGHYSVIGLRLAYIF